MNNTLEIKIQDLKNLNKEEYLLVDIREEAAFAHGFIPNAVNILCQGFGRSRSFCQTTKR